MTTYISILRGINVGGYNKIKMDALKQLYSESGFRNIQTYVQSGNVIFQNDPVSPHELMKKIEDKIVEKLGFKISVIVKEYPELKQIAADNPFINDNNKDVSYFHVTFLSEKPDESKFKTISEGSYKPDELYLIDKAIYLYCPNGYGNTKLTNNFFENKLKVIATTRNWKTTMELINIAEKLMKHP